MADELRSITVACSEEEIGSVMAELNRIGSWLDGFSPEHGEIHIQAHVPSGELHSFSTWLNDYTKSNGRIITESV